jgi:hypothetical protein
MISESDEIRAPLNVCIMWALVVSIITGLHSRHVQKTIDSPTATSRIGGNRSASNSTGWTQQYHDNTSIKEMTNFVTLLEDALIMHPP